MSGTGCQGQGVRDRVSGTGCQGQGVRDRVSVNFVNQVDLPFTDTLSVAHTVFVATIRYGLNMEAFDALRALLPGVGVVAGPRKIQLHFTKLKELHQFIARVEEDEDHNVDPHTWHYAVTLEAQDGGPSRLRHHVHIPPKEVAAVVDALRSTAA